jgi:hypothetical protein
MKWETVHITDKIHYLKELMMNTEPHTFDNGDLYIVDALITGSQNRFSGDMGFNVTDDHMNYMKRCWNTAVENQINDSVVEKIKQKINKF